VNIIKEEFHSQKQNKEQQEMREKLLGGSAGWLHIDVLQRQVVYALYALYTQVRTYVPKRLFQDMSNFIQSHHGKGNGTRRDKRGHARNPCGIGQGHW
jgi:hypothetical protein